MIEIVEIAIIADQLRSVMLGSILKCLRIYSVSRYYGKGFTGFEYVLKDIDINIEEGMVRYDINGIVNNVFTRGKLLFFDVKSNRNLTFMNSFGSNGKYSFNKPRVPSFCLEIEKNGEIINIYFEDNDNKTQFKCFAFIEEYNLAVREIAQDYLNPETNLKYFKEKIIAPRMKDITISNFLISQKWISGLGEYLRSEILYESKMMPERVLGTFSEKDILTLFNSIRKIINESYKQGGRITRTSFAPNGLIGSYQCKIYEVSHIKDNIKVNMVNNKGKLYWINH